MREYNLSFITDEHLFKHVKDTILKYKFKVDLKAFNKNLIDPIKLTFDSAIYDKSIEEVVESEVMRQIDKSNTNHIGYFHQNIFNYIGEGWLVPTKGYDVVNEKKNIFVEMKNKHNTMNSASSQKTYMKMQNEILKNDKATCLLVEVIAKQSHDIKWSISLNNSTISNKNIRRVSIDKFYEMVTGETYAFKNLCHVLPQVIKDAVQDLPINGIENSVFTELKKLSSDKLESLYLLAFSQYEGFKEIE